MGGVAGHLSHLYDNRDLSFNKLKKILSDASNGRLVGTEKTDGANIFLSWRNGKAVSARNKNDLLHGGMDARALAAREFAGGDKVRQAFVIAFDAYEKTVTKMGKKLQDTLFGDGTIWYNTEIQGPQFSNVINYDKNVITIHRAGHLKVLPDGSTEPFVDETAAKLLDKAIDKVEQSPGEDFTLQRTAVVKLNALSNDKDLKIAKIKIDKIIEEAGLSNSDTIGDYVRQKLSVFVGNQLPEISKDIQSLVVENILGNAKLTGPDGLPRGMSKDVRSRISAIKKAAPRVLDKIMWPLESVIHDFTVEILKGFQSAYILDNKKELKRLRQELAVAIKAIQSSGNDRAMEILQKQLAKIKSASNINTPAEGFVFDYDGVTYKFTGNFAPINQILGLFRYGRGKSVPPMQKPIKEEDIVDRNDGGKTVAILPGGFKPPHAGHYANAKYFADMPGVDLVYILISPKGRGGHSGDNRIEIDKDMSRDLWELYTKNDRNIKFKIVDTASPVKAAYDFMERLNPGDKLVLGMGEKEVAAGDTRFNNAQGWSDKNNLGVDVKIIATPMFAGGVSGTQMREIIAAGNDGEFMKYIPPHLSPEEKKMAWRIVRRGSSLNESELYQDKIKAKHAIDKKRIVATGPQNAGSAYPENPELKRAKSAPPGFGSLGESEEIEECSAMGAGAVAIAPNKKEDYTMEQFDRHKFIEEITLREHIRRAIRFVERKKSVSKLISEQKLRKHVRTLLKEVTAADKVPHHNTGINVLEELLKKIIPTLSTDYKILTTDPTQRKSFRAHIINAVQNSIAPHRSSHGAGSGDEESSKMIHIDEVDFIAEEESDMTVTVGSTEPGEEEDKFIDIDDEPTTNPKDQEEMERVDSFTLHGEDMTGRNMALDTYDKIEQNILDSYNMLENEEDRQLFYDYLLTNLKLYFDKFEDELAGSLEEPTTDEYEQEKDNMEIADEEGGMVDAEAPEDI